ncbi:MAG: hypothetical protein Q4D81_00430 [Eubacteriales bacterium]|nr:hypothetical protein [Eubacteriales bacterium]
MSYVRDTGMEIKLLPPGKGALIRLEVRDPATGYYERHDITDKEAAKCGNIDVYTGHVLDQMVARIGSKKATLYANRHKGNQRRDIEKLFRGE